MIGVNGFVKQIQRNHINDSGQFSAKPSRETERNWLFMFKKKKEKKRKNTERTGTLFDAENDPVYSDLEDRKIIDDLKNEEDFDCDF